MRLELIPDGDAGVAATVAKMKSLIHSPQGVRSWVVRKTVLEAVRGVERGQHEIDAIFDWIQRNIEFRGEYGETLQSPEATINLGAGDCDDQAVLGATLLNSLGYETRFRTVALHGSADELSHVYAEARDKQTGFWIPLDPTVARSYPGWEPDNVARTESYGTISPGNSSDGGLALLAGIAIALFF
jgi:transglutaminase-like putative cysteine protease